MATQHPVDEARIRQQIDKLVEAIRAMNLEGVKSIYAPDIVSFDVGPPLQHVGAEAKWRNWVEVFTAFQRPLGYEIRGLTISLDGDVAFAHSLNRLSGTLKNGNRSDFWVVRRSAVGRSPATGSSRTTTLDLESGRALLNLEP